MKIGGEPEKDSHPGINLHVLSATQSDYEKA